MKNIRDTDRFLIERGTPYKNYYATAKEFSDYIPSFKPGTVCLFYENTAPEGWTQVTDTTVDESIIRLIETGGSGGSLNNTMDFKDGFANRTPPIPRHKHNSTGNSHTHSVSSQSHGHGVNNPTHNHTLATAAHTHSNVATYRTDQNGGNLKPRGGETTPSIATVTTSGASGGGGGASGSNMTCSVNNSSNTAYGSTGNANAGVTGINSASIGSTMDFRVKYSECILCTKDN